MKKSSLFIVAAIILTLNFNAQAVLRKTYSITSSVAEEMEEWIDKDTMVFIALDYTLVRPDYKMFASGVNPYKNFESNLISNAKRKKSGIGRLQQWYEQRKLVLIEDEWKGFIQRAKDKGAMVFGICDMPMSFKNIEQKRYLEIYNLDIQFSPTIKDKNVIVLGEERNWLSVFYQGIIFSGPYNNAKAIEKLMQETQYVPKKVVYFDYRESDVRRVDSVLRPFRMNFYSVIYWGIRKYQPKINYDEVKFQQMHFLETGELLDDQEVTKGFVENAEKTSK